MDTHSDMPIVRGFINWIPIDSVAMDGKKYSQMSIESVTTVLRLIYEDIWHIILEVAQELPDKGSYYKSVELLPEGDDTKVGDIYRDGDGSKSLISGMTGTRKEPMRPLTMRTAKKFKQEKIS